MAPIGASDTAISTTSWFSRWTCERSKPSAIAEQAGQPAVYSGPNMKWYTRSCERPRKRSASEAPPSSVSNRYCLSIRTHGSSCRRRASSSLRRVSSFSAASSSSRAASHSSRVPVLCVAIALLSVRRLSFVVRSSTRVAEFRLPAGDALRDEVEHVPHRAEVVARRETGIGDAQDFSAAFLEHRHAGQRSVVPIAHVLRETRVLDRDH